jgi:hypothetical protein
MIQRAVLSFLAVAAAAFAQEQVQRPPVAIRYELDGERVSVTVDGAAIRVEIDGAEAGDERVKRHDDGVEICDRDGVPVAGAHSDGRSVRLVFFEQVRSAWLGVDLTPVEEALANHLGLDREKVALVTGVAEGSPAAQAGLCQHDIVVRFDGEEPATLERLREILAERRPGEVLRIGYLRRGESQEVEARLQRAKPWTGGWSHPYALYGALQPSGAWQLDPSIAGLKWKLDTGNFMPLTEWKDTWPLLLQAQKAQARKASDLQSLYSKLGRTTEPEAKAEDRRGQMDELKQQIEKLQETLQKLVEKRKD